ncbi:MarR family winged helix-turn-helix transcriptional regulator [Amycolatopsis saalfeldensis]|nr:MarR family winged helix-turn-helix transcriptional regulator [Amycolatopsis saalfeldensis]
MSTSTRATTGTAGSLPGWEHPELALRGSTGHLLRRAMQVYTSVWTSTVSDKLTSPQFAVLAVLSTEESLDQQTIGARAGLDKSTCGHLVEHLGKLGLVSATVDPANRRRKLVSLTERGRDTLRTAAPLRAQAEETALAALTGKEKRELSRLLGKMTGLNQPE